MKEHCKQLVKVQLRYQDRSSTVTCVSRDDFNVSHFRVGKANTIPEGLKQHLGVDLEIHLKTLKN